MLLIPTFPTRRNRKRREFKEKWVLNVAILKLIFVVYGEKNYYKVKQYSGFVVCKNLCLNALQLKYTQDV